MRGSQGGVTKLEPAAILVTQIEAIKVTHRSTGTITGHKAFTLIAHRGADAIHFLAVQAHIRLAAIAAFKHVNLDARALMIASGLFAAIRHILYGAGYGHTLSISTRLKGIAGAALSTVLINRLKQTKIGLLARFILALGPG